MARYIDADKLKKLRDDVISGKFDIKTESDLIDMCPTEDVVKVVRCKECKHFEQMYDMQTGQKLYYGICFLNTNPFNDEEVNCEHFCGYGERKSD